MWKYNTIAGIIYLGFASLIIYQSKKLGLGAVTSPGAGFFPILTATPLALLASLLILKMMLNKNDNEEGEVIWPSRDNKRKIIITLSTLVIYTIVLNLLGYFLSTFLLLLTLFKVEPQKWVIAISIAGIAVLIAYFIFGIVFQIPLPEGFLSWG